MDEKSVARFWGSVDRRGPDECWMWTGCTNACGYGRFGAGPTRKTHRISWELANGPIPDGLCVCHRCDVRACVNPSHLFLGTAEDNRTDMIAKGRSRAPWGESHGSARLSADNVRTIRALRRAGIKGREVARRFGVHPATVSDIVCGRRWTHLPEQEQQ